MLPYLHSGAQPRPRSRVLPTWPSTSRNEELINSKRLVTAHFKGACGQQLLLGQAEPCPWDTCAPCALAQKPACVCVLPERLFASCICSCAGHMAAKPLRPQKGACACARLWLRPCTCARVYVCRHEDGSSRHQQWHERARLAWMHRLCLCSYAQHERGTRTRVFLPSTAQPVSFQKIRP